LKIAAHREYSALWRITAVCERILAALLLLLLLPMLIVFGMLAVILSRRGPLIAHRRMGYRGQEIWVPKLRTMWDSRTAWDVSSFVERLSSESLPELKMRRDPRVTSRFAALCRKYSIDELPQLWSVVRGEMALIGPRPLTAKELEVYYRSDLPKVLSVRPGLTGLWQVRGRSHLTYAQRRKLDLFMIRKWSIGLYVRILAESVPTVLAGKNAW
jgi:lipopolysaccharide/colanic/teichoic acid biosynthesis glycosyltransferase